MTDALGSRVENEPKALDLSWDADVARLNAQYGGAPEHWPRRRAHVRKDWVFNAIVARGGEVREACRVLVAPLAAEIQEIDATSPYKLAPNLSVLNLLSSLQCLGLEVETQAVEIATAWLIGMDSAGVEPPYLHYERGLAALAFNQPRVYRPVAGFDHTEPMPFDPDADPEFNIQGWLAHFAAAKEADASFAQVEPAWHRFLAVYESRVDAEVILSADLLWFARIVRHTIGGAPLGEVADWMHHSVRRFVGLEA